MNIEQRVGAEFKSEPRITHYYGYHCHAIRGGHWNAYDPCTTSVEDLIANAPQHIVAVSTWFSVKGDLIVYGHSVKVSDPKVNLQTTFFKGELKSGQQLLDESAGWKKIVDIYKEDGIEQFVKVVGPFGINYCYKFNPEKDQFKPELGVKK